MKRVNIAAPGEAKRNTGATIPQLREAQRRRQRSQTKRRDQMRQIAQCNLIECALPHTKKPRPISRSRHKGATSPRRRQTDSGFQIGERNVRQPQFTKEGIHIGHEEREAIFHADHVVIVG